MGTPLQRKRNLLDRLTRRAAMLQRLAETQRGSDRRINHETADLLYLAIMFIEGVYARPAKRR